MTSNGPDFYRQRVAHAGWTWREAKACSHIMGPRRRKNRSFSRADKRASRQAVRSEVASDDADTTAALSADPCMNGSCAFCLSGSDETDFERTRIAAAQRGAI